MHHSYFSKNNVFKAQIMSHPKLRFAQHQMPWFYKLKKMGTYQRPQT